MRFITLRKIVEVLLAGLKVMVEVSVQIILYHKFAKLTTVRRYLQCKFPLFNHFRILVHIGIVGRKGTLKTTTNLINHLLIKFKLSPPKMIARPSHDRFSHGFVGLRLTIFANDVVLCRIVVVLTTL
jgi:hypothetical protein